MKTKKSLAERVLKKYGYTKLENTRSAQDEHLVKIEAARQADVSGKDAQEIGLAAVARTVARLNPALSLQEKNVEDILNPEMARKRLRNLQGDDLNRQVLVEVSDLHLEIASLNESILTYDEYRREDAKYLSGGLAKMLEREIIRKEGELKSIIEDEMGKDRSDMTKEIVSLLRKNDLMKWLLVSLALAVNVILVLIIIAKL